MIYIKKDSDTPLYLQIYQQIKANIMSGSSSPGDMLPGIRSLSKRLGVARNTVEKAYSQLDIEGYIEAKIGAGFIIQNVSNNNSHLEISSQKNISEPINSDIAPDKHILYDFQYGNLPLDEFPTKYWKKYTYDILFSPLKENINRYHEKQGDLILRTEIKKHLRRARGVNCSEAQIIVGCGLDYSLEIICKLISGKRKIIAIENPSYYAARAVFLNNGYKLYPIPVEEKGLDFSILSSSDSNAIYVTPSHQFPYGKVMSIYKRNELLEWAAANNSYIIEDDYDSEFRYDVNPIPSLQSIDSSDCVIYIGTFSKSLCPSLRVNYMVLPNRLIPVYQKIYKYYNCPVSWITQCILAKYMQDKLYERHVKKMCLLYRRRHDAFVKSVEEIFGDRIILHEKGSGIHFILEVKTHRDQHFLIERAEEFGVRIYSTEPFWIDPSDCPYNMLFAGFSTLDEHQIKEGLKLLKKAWFE